MTDRELMQQALDALESATGYVYEKTSTGKEIVEAITALRERLAQMEALDRIAQIDRELGL